MRESRLFVVLGIILLVLCSCRIEADPQIVQLKKQVEQLQKDAANNTKEIKSLKGMNTFLLTMISDIENQPAYVSTDAKDYAIARNQYGSFSVNVEEVKPYLDGYKITLKIGNLTDATLTDATINLHWGKHGVGHQKEFNLADDVLPGRYTIAEFTASPANPEEVKTIGVGIKFGGMKLHVPIKH